MSGVNWTEEQLAAHRRQTARELCGALAPFADSQAFEPRLRSKNLTEYQKATGRISQSHGPNKTEQRYRQHLEAQKATGAVIWCAFEDMTLRLGQDCRFTPDFSVWMADGSVQFHEVKGRRKNGKVYYEDDARVKIAAAAKQYPMFKFFMVWPGERGEWESKEF